MDNLIKYLTLCEQKEATRGQKQILEENKSTIQFYLIMSCSSMATYLILMTFLFSDSFTLKYQALAVFAGLVFAACILTMNFMAKASFSESGSLLDGGLDLNMKDGFAEHLKDLIILTTAVQILSLTWNYFWFLWLFAPGRAAFLLWTGFIAPWLFAPPPEVDQEREDKKQKKQDRRMRRMQ
jgi:hypothetical protein